ncbi:TPA: hypothetical protein N2N40_002447 [Citrobacter freundii]|nr:hypothetical protein [Citrobacter freundii]
MINDIKLFYPQKSETLPRLEASELLKTAPFGVFLAFIDPRTSTYVQHVFPFFYDPVNTYGLKGRCFISEWDGLNLYIPADLGWYIDGQQNPRYCTKVFRQELGYLCAGRFVTKAVSVEVSVNIRVGIEFDVVFLPLLSRSGHGRLATAAAGSRLSGIC